MKCFLLSVSLSYLVTADSGSFSLLGADRGIDAVRKLRGEPVFSAEFGIFCTRRCENPGESCIPNPARYNIQKDVYQCTCSEGHVYTANNDACKFEEQCTVGASPCGKNAECVQNEGGFACVCPTDWTGGAYTECIAPESLQTPAPVAATPAPVPVPVPSTPAPQQGFIPPPPLPTGSSAPSEVPSDIPSIM